MVTRFLRSLWGTFWILFSTLLIGAAVVVVLLRVTLPDVGLFKSDLQQWIEAQTGIVVDIGEIKLTLDGRFLQLATYRVKVLEPTSRTPELSFGRGEVYIDLVQSLRKREIVTTHFAIHQPRLEVVHRSDGSFQIGNLEGEAPVPVELIGWLLNQPQLRIEDAELLLREERLAALDWHLRRVDLALINSGYRHQASGRMVLNGHEQPVEMELEWFGDLLNPRGWDGQIHLRGEKLALLALIGGEQNPLRGVVQGEANLEFWGEWLSGHLEKARGSLRRDPRFFNMPGLASGEFFWKKQGERSWRLQMEQLAWGGAQEQERSSHPSSAVVIHKPGPQGQDLLMGAVDHVRLVASPEQSGLYATLDQGNGGVKVAGDLRQLKFRSFPNEGGLLNGVEVKVVLDRLSAQGIEQMAGYGIAGVSGLLHLNQQQGYFIPARGRISMRLGSLYPEPQQLNLHQGVAHWERHPAGVIVTLERLLAEWGGILLGGGAQVLAPASGGAPVVDLRMEMKAQRVTDVVEQLPVPELDPELLSWLQQALLSGSVDYGVMKIQGPLDRRFPYEAGGGTFEVELDLGDVYLQFDPEWPTITHSQARLSFYNERIRVALSEGKLDGHPIHNIVANGFTVGEEPVVVRGQIVSDSAKLLRTLEQTPLREEAREINAALALDGYALLDLDVTVPLSDDPEQVKGRVELHDNTLMIRDIGLSAQQLHGNIDFSDEGVAIDGMIGEMLGGPMRLTAFTAESEARQQVVVNVEGDLQGEALKRWMKLKPVQRALFEGREATHWEGRIVVDEEDLVLHLHSALEGILLRTPAPLNKEGDESWPTSLTMKMHQGEVHDLRISSPRHLFAALKHREMGDERPPEWSGQIRVGDLSREISPEALSRNVTLQGVFEQINLDQWYALWKEQLEQEQTRNLSRFRVDQMLLLADQAELFQQQLNNLSLVMHLDSSDHWGIGVSSDQVEGKIRVPATTRETLEVDLNYLRLADEDEGGEDGSLQIDPSQFPPMRVSSQSTWIKGIDFGKLSLQAHPTEYGVIIDQAKLDSPVMQATAKGSWVQRDHLVESRFTIDVTGDQLGAILGQFGYGGEIDQGKSVIHLSAAWPDTPLDFSLEKMSGELEVSVEKGHLKNVDQGVGRVFGLLGIHTLVRRLTLDFSDITDKGFAFDTIGGTFMVSEGDAHTRNLVIDGTAATIKVAGRTGLVAQDYDQIVSVSPKISETLPATGALVGGPAGAAVGSVLLLYQKLFQQEGLAVTRYRLTGGWEDPQLEEIRPKAPVSEPSILE